MSQTILNVEDTKENRDLVRRILESEGYTVIDAVNALEGIEKAQEIIPNLILMDINLPDMDGFTAVTRIRSFVSLKEVPIIALTARNVSDDRQRAKAIGCDSYLNKPVDFDELINEVAHYISVGHKVKDAETKREHYLHEQSVTLIAELEKKFAEMKIAYDRLKNLEDAKSNLMLVVAHELRTPLTVINSYTQMLGYMPSVAGDKGAKEMLEELTKGVARLQEIINDIVSAMRVELSGDNSQFTPVSVRSVLNAIETEKIPIIAERKQTLNIEIGKNLPMAVGDAKQLQSAISRIVANAIKYTPDGGQITLSASTITKNKDGGERTFIQIVIADTGVGIDPEKQQMIFDTFSTAEDVSLHSSGKTGFMAGGAGLGLTIARGVVKSHDGEIWVESDGNNKETLPGSKFFILLPAM